MQLLIRPGSLGDCILSFPALEFLADEQTELWISSPAVPLVWFVPRVKSIASTGIDLLGIEDVAISESLKDELSSFSSIFSWYGSNRPEFREAMLALNPNTSFHPALPSNGREHAIDFFARQAGAPPGLHPRIENQAKYRRDEIVIHPFSGSASKNWELGSFGNLAGSLPLPVEWTAGPEEVLPEARRFEDIADLAKWIGGARLYIGNDSGITHLAAALGVPTIAIFVSTSPEVWGPRAPQAAILERPDVETVLRAANRLLR